MLTVIGVLVRVSPARYHLELRDDPDVYGFLAVRGSAADEALQLVADGVPVVSVGGRVGRIDVVA